MVKVVINPIWRQKWRRKKTGLSGWLALGHISYYRKVARRVAPLAGASAPGYRSRNCCTFARVKKAHLSNGKISYRSGHTWCAGVGRRACAPSSSRRPTSPGNHLTSLRVRNNWIKSRDRKRTPDSRIRSPDPLNRTPLLARAHNPTNYILT